VSRLPSGRESSQVPEPPGGPESLTRVIDQGGWPGGTEVPRAPGGPVQSSSARRAAVMVRFTWAGRAGLTRVPGRGLAGWPAGLKEPALVFRAGLAQPWPIAMP